MFQFRRFPTYDYFIHHRLTDLHLPGCPIRKSPDISLAYSSPRLIAVNHVLLRLPVPRHSPCALCSLTFFYVRLSSVRSTSLSHDRLVWTLFAVLTRCLQFLVFTSQNRSLHTDCGSAFARFRKVRIMRFSKFEIFEFFVTRSIIVLITLKILYLFKTVGTVSYLSFVLHFFIRFSRNDFSDLKSELNT